MINGKPVDNHSYHRCTVNGCTHPRCVAGISEEGYSDLTSRAAELDGLAIEDATLMLGSYLYRDLPSASIAFMLAYFALRAHRDGTRKAGEST